MTSSRLGSWRPDPWHGFAAVVSVPILLAAVRAVRRDYLPIGDNALIEIRARDVLTAHHPWLGTWSSASISSGVDVNHPGPLLFDILALPVKVLGAGPGIAFGVAALQIAVVWAIGWCANRIGGRSAALVALAVTGLFVWSLGSELLYDPWPPNLLMLPFLLLLVLVWGVVAGRHGMLAWAVLVASLCVQTHVGHIFLAPALVAGAAVVVAVRWWRVRSSELAPVTEPTPVTEAELATEAEAVPVTEREAAPVTPPDRPWRPLAIAAAVGVLAWSQPILEQLFGPGRGNLSRLAASGGGGEAARTGASLGVRVMAAVVALPPWWSRPGMVDSVPISQWTDGPTGRELMVPGLVGLAGAVVAMAGLAALITVAWVVAHRRDDTVASAGAAVTALATTMALVTVVITPIDDLGLSPHKFRWLWPIGAFTTLVLALTLVRAMRIGDRPLTYGLGAVTVVAAAATIPFHAHDAGPVTDRADIPRIRGLIAQLAPLEGRGVVLFDPLGMRFAEPFSTPVMGELRRRGVPFVLDDEGWIRQMGERRRNDGTAEHRVYVREREEALVVPAGVERIAFQPGLDDAEQAELATLQRRLDEWRETEGIDPADLVATDVETALGADAERFAELERRWRDLALAVFVEPLR